VHGVGEVRLHLDDTQVVPVQVLEAGIAATQADRCERGHEGDDHHEAADSQRQLATHPQPESASGMRGLCVHDRSIGAMALTVE
jgi:hypothetical protein